MILYLKQNPVVYQGLAKESKDEELFSHFLSVLLNDVIFLLDDALGM